MRATRLAAGISLLMFGRAGVPAQAGGADPVGARADSLYFAHPDKSLAFCEEQLAIADDAGLHWRAARADIAMGMMIPESPRRKELYDSALAHARRGLALMPDSVETRYWVAASAGRRAHRDDPILSIRLAYEVYEQVTAILAVDSLHAGAHHALGALNSEVLRAPRFVRFVAARILRMDLAKRASWTEAELHMRRAVELDPRVMMYGVDLADLSGRAGRTAQRDSALARLNAVTPLHPQDRIIRDAVLARWKSAPAP